MLAVCLSLRMPFPRLCGGSFTGRRRLRCRSVMLLLSPSTDAVWQQTQNLSNVRIISMFPQPNKGHHWVQQYACQIHRGNSMFWACTMVIPWCFEHVPCFNGHYLVIFHGNARVFLYLFTMVPCWFCYMVLPCISLQ